MMSDSKGEALKSKVDSCVCQVRQEDDGRFGGVHKV